MNDLEKERSLFESLPQIEAILAGGYVYFSTLSMNYSCNKPDREHCVYYINGAWYAWIEKAKTQAMQWQPIDTAPKNKNILLQNSEGIFQGKWDKDDKKFRPLILDYHGCGCCGGGYPQPECWMELPTGNESGAEG